ncbi:MAG: single-stranded-DNA-specific exonuclease RecJ, partial [Bacillota bacterium]|nr:single-stranded-DNA-specific exonuclease RecJ [Bacillota bacterium]
MAERLWIYNEIPDRDVLRLSEEAQISTLLAKIFINRGINDKHYINRFLNPTSDGLHDPFLMKDMEKAVDRIIKAVSGNERILIYGDYDVDGVTSSSLLFNFLKNLNANVDYFVPDRINDGYGITLDTARKILDTGCTLTITVDCGISSIEEINFLNSRNIDVIITDHHECRDSLPDAYAVINPKRPDCPYPFKELAGVGITFKLVTAMCKKLELGRLFDEYLDLVTIGTIADVVPLVDENRIIVSNGLKELRNTSNIGLQELFKICNSKNEDITTWMVSFVIAPRINAAGRIGDAARAVKLFTTNDMSVAKEVASLLNNENKSRQDIESRIISEVIERIEADRELVNKKVMVLSGEDWHHGIIGIVASKITERYYKPCILLSSENGICKGSGRSIEGFNLFMALSHCEKLLDQYGGHEMAAGLTLKLENLETFDNMLNQYADKVMNEEDLIPRIKINARLLKNEINLKSIAELEMLAPFGAGNPSPVFMCRRLQIADMRTVGNDKHLKAVFGQNGWTVDAIGFNMGDLSELFSNEDIVDVVCTLERNTWNSVDRTQLNIKDLRLTDEILSEQKYYGSLEKCVGYYNEDVSNI